VNLFRKVTGTICKGAVSPTDLAILDHAVPVFSNNANAVTLFPGQTTSVATVNLGNLGVLALKFVHGINEVPRNKDETETKRKRARSHKTRSYDISRGY
jgi:hypothetical protein